MYELGNYLSDKVNLISIDHISMFENEVKVDALKSFGIKDESAEPRLIYTKIINSLQADYIVINMGCTSDEGDIEAMPDWQLDDNILYQLLDTFIDVVRTSFLASHILLVRYHNPDFLVMEGKYLKDEHIICQNKKEKSFFIRKCEDYFVKNTHCINIPLARGYFRKKCKGIDYQYLFEDECYLDISDKLIGYLNGIPVNFNRVDFGKSLKRYMNFYYNTLCIRAFGLFLDGTILTDEFVLSSTKETVDYYQKELLELDKRFDWRNPEHCFAKLETIHLSSKEEEVFYLLKAFWCIKNKELEKTDCIYVKKLFCLATVSNSTLIEIRTEYHKMDRSVTAKDITAFNAGYYFAVLNGDAENANQYIDARYLISPVRMDVFGSCVSRVCLNERYSENNNIVVPNLWWHVPPYRTKEEAVKYENTLFPEVMNYHMRNVKLQFDNCINKAVTQSNADWVLVDLYSLLTSNTYIYQGLVYTDFQRIISNSLGAKRVSIWGDDSFFGKTDKLKESIMPWCENILDRYQDNIILLNCKLYNEYISDDDIIIPFPGIGDSYKIRNEQAQEIFHFLKEKWNCYVIDITDSFLSDELGYSGKAVIHYELMFYKAVSRKIWYIVNKKPDIKQYKTYSGEIRISQLIRLMHNNPISKIKQYYNNVIDSIVLQIPLDVLKNNVHKIAEIYDRYWIKIDQYDSDRLRKSILECLDLSENLDLQTSICSIE